MWGRQTASVNLKLERPPVVGVEAKVGFADRGLQELVLRGRLLHPLRPRGHGRTGLFAAALLGARGLERIDKAVEALQATRPGIRLNTRQMAVLKEFRP